MAKTWADENRATRAKVVKHLNDALGEVYAAAMEVRGRSGWEKSERKVDEVRKALQGAIQEVTE